MPGQKLRILSAKNVAQAVPMEDAIGLMQEAFIQLSGGQAMLPVRMNMEIPQAQGRFLIMPVYLPNNRQIGVKIVSIMDNNPARGLPLIHAMVMVLDSKNGRPLALMDGEYLTALRTGAASGLATDLLARKDSKVVAIIGAGVQGRFQLEAVCKVREITRAFILDRTAEKARQFSHEMSDKLPLPVEAAESTAAIREADIICTATTSTEPVLSHDDLKPGVHINGIGAYKPSMREIPAEIVLQAKVVVDHRKSCLSEAGDLIQPMQHGVITKGHIHAEIGEIAGGNKIGRESDDEITFFKSVGNAVQDLAVATQVLVKAEKLGLGTEAAL